MKIAVRVCLVAFLAASVVRAEAPLGAAGSAAAAPVTYGKGVTLTTTTSLDQLLKNPKSFEGKTVRVEGVVTAVCEMMGCWMALGTKDAPGVQTMMIKVDDGVIVFPVSAKGKKAAAQGVVQKIAAGDHEANEAAHEKAQATGGHAAHDAGAASHAAGAAGHSAPAGHAGHAAAPAVADSWQLKATGAIVY